MILCEWDAQKETLDKAVYTCLLVSMAFTSVSIFSFRCYSSVSISMVNILLLWGNIHLDYTAVVLNTYSIA
jgi:hypothetical protein